ncbi:MAG: hypothetical protein HY598_02160 [Candidatus Omnitrophica bacterium]|nr:hypothetical protein [Candidatus Omnitrophota bacterium]
MAAAIVIGILRLGHWAAPAIRRLALGRARPADELERAVIRRLKSASTILKKGQGMKAQRMLERLGPAIGLQAVVIKHKPTGKSLLLIGEPLSGRAAVAGHLIEGLEGQIDPHQWELAAHWDVVLLFADGDPSRLFAVQGLFQGTQQLSYALRRDAPSREWKTVNMEASGEPVRVDGIIFMDLQDVDQPSVALLTRDAVDHQKVVQTLTKTLHSTRSPFLHWDPFDPLVAKALGRFEHAHIPIVVVRRSKDDIPAEQFQQLVVDLHRLLHETVLQTAWSHGPTDSESGTVRQAGGRLRVWAPARQENWSARIEGIKREITRHHYLQGIALIDALEREVSQQLSVFRPENHEVIRTRLAQLAEIRGLLEATRSKRHALVRERRGVVQALQQLPDERVSGPDGAALRQRLQAIDRALAMNGGRLEIGQRLETLSQANDDDRDIKGPGKASGPHEPGAGAKLGPGLIEPVLPAPRIVRFTPAPGLGLSRRPLMAYVLRFIHAPPARWLRNLSSLASRLASSLQRLAHFARPVLIGLAILGLALGLAVPFGSSPGKFPTPARSRGHSAGRPSVIRFIPWLSTPQKTSLARLMRSGRPVVGCLLISVWIWSGLWLPWLQSRAPPV